MTSKESKKPNLSLLSTLHNKANSMSTHPQYLSIAGPPTVPPIYLTHLYAGDAAGMQRVLDDASVNRCLISIPTPYTLEHATQWISLSAASAKFPGIIRLHSSSEDGVFIGACGLTEDEMLAGCYELGYYLNPSWSGKGIMGCVLRGLVAELERWGVREVVVKVETGNLASEALIKKLGWKEDGEETAEWPEVKGGRVSCVRRWKWVARGK